MPVVFRVSPEAPRDMTTISLSYTFFEQPREARHDGRLQGGVLELLRRAQEGRVRQDATRSAHAAGASSRRAWSSALVFVLALFGVVKLVTR